MITFIPLISFGQNLDKEFAKTNGIMSTKLYSHKISNEKISSSRLLTSRFFDKKGNIIEEYSGIYYYHKKCKYDSAENIIEEVYYNPSGSKREIKTWEYDYENSGRILKHITYYVSSKSTYTSNYVYNEQGQNVEKYDIKYGEKYRITTKKYYDSGELREECYELNKNDTTWIKRYDECGNLIYKFEKIGGEKKYKIKYVDSSCKIDSILQIDTVRHIENGKELTKIIELRLGKYWWLKEKNINIFDENGKLIINEMYEYENDSVLWHSNISFFNEQEQLIESREFYSGKSIFDLDEPSPDKKIHIKYEYYNNGLRKYTYYFDENGVKTERREHEYHDNGLRKFDYYFNEKGTKIECIEFQIEYF